MLKSSCEDPDSHPQIPELESRIPRESPSVGSTPIPGYKERPQTRWIRAKPRHCAHVMQTGGIRSFTESGSRDDTGPHLSGRCLVVFLSLYPLSFSPQWSFQTLRTNDRTSACLPTLNLQEIRIRYTGRFIPTARKMRNLLRFHQKISTTTKRFPVLYRPRLHQARTRGHATPVSVFTNLSPQAWPSQNRSGTG